MQQPITGVVGDKGDLEGFTSIHEERVLQRSKPTTGKHLLEMRAMQMHRMWEGSVVLYGDADDFASRRCHERGLRQARLSVESPNLALGNQFSGVQNAAFVAALPQAAHRAAFHFQGDGSGFGQIRQSRDWIVGQRRDFAARHPCVLPNNRNLA